MSGARPWRFLAPALAVLALVAGWPVLRTVFYAFTNASLLDPGAHRWVGLANFQDLLRDADWWRSVWNTVRFAAVSVTAETALGLGLALLLHAKFPGRGLARACALVPWAVPTVVSAKMWAWMLNDQFGAVNAALMHLGLVRHPIAWLAEDATALWAVAAVDVWKTTPFMALLLLAGLQTIPEHLHEAARLDGASAWRRFRDITLPLLRPALLVAVLFRALDALRIFDLPFVLTSNSRSTAVMSVFARQQLMDFQDVGYGSAASFLIFVVVGSAALLLIAAGRRRWEAGP
ncbi:MAG TPA: sugar ABC transporter permease [Holophagaceae bacterium]|nr:sugar ABC transporter permease [Holophagaceae bacterium]